MASRRDFFSRLYKTGAGGALLLGPVWSAGAEIPTSTVAPLRSARRDDLAPYERLGGVEELSGIEELRGLTSASKSGLVWLKYHTAPGDGGGGGFFLDHDDTTSLDNNGTVIRSKAGHVWKRPNLLDVTVAQFGAQGTLLSDDSNAVQQACDAVRPIIGKDDFSAGRVWIDPPRVGYLLKSVLNLTNTRAAGTLRRDGLTLEGAGHWSARLVGAGGEGRAVIETTGSQFLTLRNLRIEAHAQNGSTIGIYQGIGSELPETQNQKLERVFIDLPDSASANQGTGTIGILNFGAEENTYECCYIIANAPAIFTAEDFGYKYSHAAQLKIHSLGMTTFIGENFLVARNARSPSLATQDVDSFHAPSLYLANVGTGGSNKHAWEIRGGFIGGEIGGLIEGHSVAFKAYGRMQNASVRFVFGGVADVKAERFHLEARSEGIIWESSLNFWDQESPNRPLMACAPVSPLQKVPCFIRNTDIRSNADKQFQVIQENVLWNPKTGNLSIEGIRGHWSPWRLEIGDHKQSVNIPPTKLSPDGNIATSELCRVILPAAVTGGKCALSATLRISGLLNSISSTPSPATGFYLDEVVVVAVDDKGNAVANSANMGAKASMLSGCNSISIKQSKDASGGVTMSVILSVQTTDHASLFTFVGQTELTWYGNDSRAPQLSCET